MTGLYTFVTPIYIYVYIYIQIYIYIYIYIYLYIMYTYIIYTHCKKLLQMLPVEVAVILQYYCESAVTCCGPTVKFLNLQ